MILADEALNELYVVTLHEWLARYVLQNASAHLVDSDRLGDRLRRNGRRLDAPAGRVVLVLLAVAEADVNVTRVRIGAQVLGSLEVPRARPDRPVVDDVLARRMLDRLTNQEVRVDAVLVHVDRVDDASTVRVVIGLAGLVCRVTDPAVGAVVALRPPRVDLGAENHTTCCELGH